MGHQTGRSEKRVTEKKENLVTRMYENKMSSDRRLDTNQPFSISLSHSPVQAKLTGKAVTELFLASKFASILSGFEDFEFPVYCASQ